MGKGILRRRKVAQMQAAVEQMQKDSQELINDPEGAFQKLAKPLIAQLQAATYEKNKLSALVCALLESQGGKVAILRGGIDKFQKHRITILTETPTEDDGVNPEIPIMFSFSAEEVQQPPINQPPVQPEVTVVEPPSVADVAKENALRRLIESEHCGEEEVLPCDCGACDPATLAVAEEHDEAVGGV